MALHVLQVVPELKSGGVERGTIEIADALTKAGHFSYVCSNGGGMTRDLQVNGSKHIKLPVNSKNPFRMIANVYALRKLIRKHGIDIIHARSRAPAWSCFFAAKLTGIVFITTFHGAYNAATPIKRFYNSIMLKGQRVIAVSNYIKKHMETFYHFVSDNIAVIPRGVDFKNFAPEAVSRERIAQMENLIKQSINKELGDKIILLPARFARWKGHIYLLEALRYLKHKDYICLFVGDVSNRHLEYRDEIESLIIKYKLRDNVYMMPAVSDMPALYSLADIVASASQEPEAFGRTITEAQAMEKIVIATNIGAPLETVIDGKTGFLVEYNSPSCLAAILESVLSMPEKQKIKITTAARKHVEKNFSLDSMCKKTLEIYENVLLNQNSSDPHTF